jgi:uncharacterized protein YgbK (DUF1537 family)
MPHTVVVADDVTGANDIGIMYAKSGWDTLVYPCGGEADALPCDALVIDTDSRFDPPGTAYRKVFDAVRAVPRDGVSQYFDKQCSVFRGNIGPEFDAMLDALGEKFAAVVLGFPNNGRTTLHGLHYVDGVLLENTQFRRDPVHPMTCSGLAEILSRQTKRNVTAIFYETYDRGADAFRAALQAAREKTGYCILDVRSNADLRFLAPLLKEERVLCGSSGLSEYLAGLAPKNGVRISAGQGPRSSAVLCAAGSLTDQTKAQLAYLRGKGVPVFELDTQRLFRPGERAGEIARVVSLLEKALPGGFAAFHSSNEPEKVAATKRLAASLGLGNTAVSESVSAAVAETACAAVKACGIRNLIVCGGDTSAALSRRLGVRGMRVLREIEPGIPTCRSVDAPGYGMVLKSGSFGSPEFLEKAARALRDE